MKTSEFIKRAEELGYEVEGDGYLCKGGIEWGRVSLEAPLLIDTVYAKMSEELFDLIIEYAKTPIEDREERKYYSIKSKLTGQSLFKNGYCEKGCLLFFETGHGPKHREYFTKVDMKCYGIDINDPSLEIKELKGEI